MPSPEIPADDLLSPRQLVSSIVRGLQRTDTTSANPLTGNLAAKGPLLTLHVLFPNELLPALDLLDRGLVTRLSCPLPNLPPDPAEANAAEQDETEGAADESPERPPRDAPQLCTYYVRSAQQQTLRSTSRIRHAVAPEFTRSYEVHLPAWSCSCPAFAFAAFPATRPARERVRGPDGPVGGWTFGGWTLGADMPVCKHLLACVLVEHGGMFAHMVEQRVVSREEMAGWAAGWGD